MNILLIAPNSVETIWEGVKPLLQQAIDRSAGETDLTDIYLRLRNDEMFLCVGTVEDHSIRAAFVCLPVVYANYGAIRVVLAAGEPMDEWIQPLIDSLERVCLTTGCDAIEFFGRPGFTRALREYADHTYHVMVRRVSDVRRQRADHREHSRQHPLGASGKPH